MMRQNDRDGLLAAMMAGMTRRNLLQDPGRFAAFTAAREAMLDAWMALIPTLDTTDALLEAQGTSWAMVQSAMLFRDRGDA